MPLPWTSSVEYGPSPMELLYLYSEPYGFISQQKRTSAVLEWVFVLQMKWIVRWLAPKKGNSRLLCGDDPLLVDCFVGIWTSESIGVEWSHGR